MLAIPDGGPLTESVGEAWSGPETSVMSGDGHWGPTAQFQGRRVETVHGEGCSDSPRQRTERGRYGYPEGPNCSRE